MALLRTIVRFAFMGIRLETAVPRQEFVHINLINSIGQVTSCWLLSYCNTKNADLHSAVYKLVKWPSCIIPCFAWVWPLLCVPLAFWTIKAGLQALCSALLLRCMQQNDGRDSPSRGTSTERTPACLRAGMVLKLISNADSHPTLEVNKQGSCV